MSAPAAPAPVSAADLLNMLVAAGIDATSANIEALLDDLPDATVTALAAPLLAQERLARENLWARLFPDDGPLRRDLYPRHIEFFADGAKVPQRCFMAANRVGKTVAGAYETTAHLTGTYPAWWPGRKFRRAGEWWVAGDTNETTRDILQKELLGAVVWEGKTKTFDGTGMIPRDAIGKVTWKSGIADYADTVLIRHKTGRFAKVGFKSYDQGRRVFQGTAKQGIWLDEEPPMDVYNECLIRLATTRGILLLTFTPLLGMSDVVLSFLPKSYQFAE